MSYEYSENILVQGAAGELYKNNFRFAPQELMSGELGV